MDKGRGFWKGTIIGAIIGSILGVLLAPKSGKETQADIRRGARNLVGDLTQTVEQMGQNLAQRIDELKSVARDLSGEAKQESQELLARSELLKRDLREAAGRLGQAGSGIKDEAAQDVKLLVKEGAALLSELERVTRKLAASAKDRFTKEG